MKEEEYDEWRLSYRPNSFSITLRNEDKSFTVDKGNVYDFLVEGEGMIEGRVTGVEANGDGWLAIHIYSERRGPSSVEMNDEQNIVIQHARS